MTCQQANHDFSSSFFDVAAPFRVVLLFIYHQVGLIAFKSGEFPGQRSFLILAKEKTGRLCFDVCDSALSSWTSVSGYSFLCSCVKGISFFFKMTSWYRYQSISLRPLFRTWAPCVAVYLYIGFLLPRLRSLIRLISFVNSYNFFALGSVKAFCCSRSAAAAFFSFAVSSFQMWQGPFL